MTTLQFYIQGNSLIIIGLLLMDRYQQYLVAIFVSLKVPQVMNGVQHAFIRIIQNGKLRYNIYVKIQSHTKQSCTTLPRSQGGSLFNPLISEMYPKILQYLKGLWPKNRAKTHDIWHSLTRGQLHVQPPCKRVDLPPYKRKCDPLLNEVMQYVTLKTKNNVITPYQWAITLLKGRKGGIPQMSELVYVIMYQKIFFTP
ncbi:Hypothetical_protein [Hexamita inflata]|uniref:Hypothetical_protein n=1 Tax=Hexamita inflata TaxID=28002 RepID=A0AA86UNQ3_9EUKA|nr:Hypothetical protein HINF_LOCUS53220 [Hexamita inflata]